MSEFLKESELTERRAFIETFVKEIVVMPGDALLRYTIPMPDDSRIPGGNAEEMPLDGSVLSTVKIGGAYRVKPGRRWDQGFHRRPAGPTGKLNRHRTPRDISAVRQL